MPLIAPSRSRLADVCCRERQLGYLAGFLTVAMLAGCVARTPAITPSSAELQRAMELGRQAEELQRDPVRARKMVEQMMGKAPSTEQPSPDGIQVVFQTGHASMINSVAMSPDGHYILSAGRDEASGNEFALEGEQWKNGVFTYALLSGLRDGKADANKDGTVTVGELQAYVINQVRRLTAGGQNPTVRRENLDYDFPVY